MDPWWNLSFVRYLLMFFSFHFSFFGFGRSGKVNYFVASQIHLLMSTNVLATDFWSKNLPYIVPEYILIFSQVFFDLFFGNY